jgi:hypothetical protein
LGLSIIAGGLLTAAARIVEREDFFRASLDSAKPPKSRSSLNVFNGKMGRTLVEHADDPLGAEAEGLKMIAPCVDDFVVGKCIKEPQLSTVRQTASATASP